ncbi:uncharacterized protein RHOBADRAFT_46300 [Rhodotorula graminis WP1]|uniref:Uncharacterized protein n=1 Tax=Rhodotorula graminis (strain WP1) TaxID=578459 RepID=A0A0P9IUP2_RHOGW|nr:uncharacterized protein RHOBADRAFT_46300 [Rhodotorula graminis WP1]KPV73192.1 hypothetical protein RHOBADRAFT_46300 [Rhodotorula graminis WP1]
MAAQQLVVHSPDSSRAEALWTLEHISTYKSTSRSVTYPRSLPPPTFLPRVGRLAAPLRTAHPTPRPSYPTASSPYRLDMSRAYDTDHGAGAARAQEGQQEQGRDGEAAAAAARANAAAEATAAAAEMTAAAAEATAAAA